MSEEPSFLSLRPQTTSNARFVELASIPFGDFKGCLDYVEAHEDIDLESAAEFLWWQAAKSLQNVIKHQTEDDYDHVAEQESVNRCVQQYTLMKWAMGCGVERLKTYLERLIDTPKMDRAIYLSSMMVLPPTERLDFLRKTVPGEMYNLKLFCLLYDYTYEKLENDSRRRSFFDKFRRITRVASSDETNI